MWKSCKLEISFLVYKKSVFFYKTIEQKSKRKEKISNSLNFSFPKMVLPETVTHVLTSKPKMSPVNTPRMDFWLEKAEAWRDICPKVI